MKRAEKILEKASEMISNGDKVTAQRLSHELGIHESDVHRCLNYLEADKKVKTFREKGFNTDHRMVSVYR